MFKFEFAGRKHADDLDEDRGLQAVEKYCKTNEIDAEKIYAAMLNVIDSNQPSEKEQQAIDAWAELEAVAIDAMCFFENSTLIWEAHSALDFELPTNVESARVYLEEKRWPDGVTCPRCREKKRIYSHAAKKVGFYRCNACLTEFTVRTGTIFERSKVPLHKWIAAQQLVATRSKNISSVQLAKRIDVTQKTAWLMIQTLREASDKWLPK